MIAVTHAFPCARIMKVMKYKCGTGHWDLGQMEDVMSVALDHTNGASMQTEVTGDNVVLSHQPVALGDGKLALLAFSAAADNYTEASVTRKQKAAISNVANRMMKAINKQKPDLNDNQKKAVNTFKGAKNNHVNAATFIATMQMNGMNVKQFCRRHDQRLLGGLLNNQKMQPAPRLANQKPGPKQYGKLKMVITGGQATKDIAQQTKPELRDEPKPVGRKKRYDALAALGL